MDVQARKVGATTSLGWRVALGLVLLLALALRLKGIHNPLLDHPGWRQGDTAAIARNFALLQYNILYPQTSYDGPPPNYVELELQIVPFLAATLYKIFGVHEIFGRLITMTFSIGTVAVLAFFARWLFADELAGFFTALLFAIMPGSIYYGRTFTPDATMVFFLTAALYAVARLVIDDEAMGIRATLRSTILLAAAFLAKPVSLAGLVPLGVLLAERARSGRTMPWPRVAAVALLPVLLLFAYDRNVASHAEWHWASGITSLHVIPSLRNALADRDAFVAKLTHFRQMLGVLAGTVSGPFPFGIAIAGLLFLPAQTRSRSLLWGWLAGGLLYIYVVVTVERVDYYMLLMLPPLALAGGAALARIAERLRASARSLAAKYAGAAAVALVLACALVQDRSIVAPYYHYNPLVYRNAVALNATLPPAALIVMGHYDPSILYYIGRYGWEEDPYLWTTFDEQSAIRKGARYFIAIERNRFARNVELCAWMQRFPVVNGAAQWPVYQTDPTMTVRGAEQQWRMFRRAEKGGHARKWLRARGLCAPS